MVARARGVQVHSIGPRPCGMPDMVGYAPYLSGLPPASRAAAGTVAARWGGNGRLGGSQAARGPSGPISLACGSTVRGCGGLAVCRRHGPLLCHR